MITLFALNVIFPETDAVAEIFLLVLNCKSPIAKEIVADVVPIVIVYVAADEVATRKLLSLAFVAVTVQVPEEVAVSESVLTIEQLPLATEYEIAPVPDPPVAVNLSVFPYAIDPPAKVRVAWLCFWVELFVTL